MQAVEPLLPALGKFQATATDHSTAYPPSSINSFRVHSSDINSLHNGLATGLAHLSPFSSYHSAHPSKSIIVQLIIQAAEPLLPALWKIPSYGHQPFLGSSSKLHHLIPRTQFRRHPSVQRPCYRTHPSITIWLIPLGVSFKLRYRPTHPQAVGTLLPALWKIPRYGHRPFPGLPSKLHHLIPQTQSRQLLS